MLFASGLPNVGFLNGIVDAVPLSFSVEPQTFNIDKRIHFTRLVGDSDRSIVLLFEAIIAQRTFIVDLVVVVAYIQ